MKQQAVWTRRRGRRGFIGGSDTRVIMGKDQDALVRLWKEKRGELEPEDLSGNLIVQLGSVTEDLNRRWYEANTGAVIKDIQRHVQHPAVRWMAATLDGRVTGSDAVFEAKFMLPWSFSEEAAAAKYMPQLQHNMFVVTARTAVLSIITGGGKWVEIVVHADPLYQHLLITAERKFWRCVENGETPSLFGVDPPKPRIEAVRIVDMNASNAWAEHAGTFTRTRDAHAEHEAAKAELKSLMPEDAREAIGHGIRAKRSKSGAVSFDVLSLSGRQSPLALHSTATEVRMSTASSGRHPSNDNTLDRPSSIAESHDENRTAEGIAKDNQSASQPDTTVNGIGGKTHAAR